MAHNRIIVVNSSRRTSVLFLLGWRTFALYVLSSYAAFGQLRYALDDCWRESEKMRFRFLLFFVYTRAGCISRPLANVSKNVHAGDVPYIICHSTYGFGRRTCVRSEI